MPFRIIPVDNFRLTREATVRRWYSQKGSDSGRNVAVSFPVTTVIEAKMQNCRLVHLFQDEDDAELWMIKKAHGLSKHTLIPYYEKTGRMRVRAPNKTDLFKQAWTGDAGSNPISFVEVQEQSIIFKL